MYLGGESYDLCDEEQRGGHDSSHIPQEGEPDFIETNCHWEGCSIEFETQGELVRVSLNCKSACSYLCVLIHAPFMHYAHAL